MFMAVGAMAQDAPKYSNEFLAIGVGRVRWAWAVPIPVW
jgi:hypothetical protein